MATQMAHCRKSAKELRTRNDRVHQGRLQMGKLDIERAKNAAAA
jgi:hypothetical protein